jgi:hypothetical protein
VEWVKAEIPRLMASVAELKVPLLAEVGVGPNWEKAHCRSGGKRRTDAPPVPYGFTRPITTDFT